MSTLAARLAILRILPRGALVDHLLHTVAEALLDTSTGDKLNEHKSPDRRAIRLRRNVACPAGVRDISDSR